MLVCRSRLLVALVVVAALGCSNGVPLPAPPSARAQHALDLGRLPADAELDFVVGLALRDRQGVRRLLEERPRVGGGLAVTEFAARFSPTQDDYDAVVAWLRGAGLLVTRVTDGRTTVSAHGNAATVERVFGAQLHLYRDAAGTFSAASTALRITPELSGVVSGVIGLEGAPAWHTNYEVITPAAGNMPLAAADLQARYNTSAIMNGGMGETVAILGAGDPPDKVMDVGKYYQAAFGATATANYDQVLVGGASRDGASLAHDEEFENAIDAEMVLAMAPQAHVVHVFAATNSPGLFADGMAYVVNQLPQAHAVSVSFGNCERGLSGEVPVVDTLLAQAQAEGQQWFFSSGDSGTDDCADGSGNKHESVDWPSSSPFAVSVGGTMLSNGVEVAWNEDAAGMTALAGGGGPSEMLAKPAYQVGATPNDGARDTPDVAAIAGAPGISLVAYGGMSYAAKGTSVAAPLWAGVWALVDQGKGGTGISDALTRIYAAGKSNGFNDITSGDNGGPDDVSKGFPAGPGYDLATGWGTPNVPNLITSIH
jgi:kumamolisin